MAELICVSCGRHGNRDELQWYEGSAYDVVLDPDESAVGGPAFLCGDCYRRIDAEDRPRWKPISRAVDRIRARTGG